MKLAKSLLKIDCNDRMRRVLLRINGGLFPLWYVFSIIVLLISTAETAFKEPWLFWTTIVWPLAALVIGSISAFVLLRSKLESDGKKLSFPGLCFSSFQLDDLRALTRADGDFHFHFQHNSLDKERIVPLSLARISEADRLKLFEFLEEHAKNCKIEEICRRTTNEHICPDLNPNRWVRVPYDSYSKLKAFIDVCCNYERPFWLVWFTCCAPVVLFVTPFAVYLPYMLFMRFLMRQQGYFPLPMQDLVTSWVSLWRPIIESCIYPANSSLSTYYDFLKSHPDISGVVVLVAAVIVFNLLRLVLRPTSVLLAPWGLQTETSKLGLHFMVSGFEWSRLKSVKVETGKKGGKTKSKIGQDLVFYGKDGPLIKLDLQALRSPLSRKLLRKAVALWAPQAELEAEFVEAAITPQRESYTELWLRSLNSPPKRDRLTPLRKGDSLKSGTLHVLDTIGSGGQGIAYLAERNQGSPDAELVVIKEFILPVYVDRRAKLQALERFEREAKMLGSLQSENIVSLKDYFTEDHRAYLVLEHIKGNSLRKLAAGKGIRDEQLLADLTRQMCRMLSYLHEQDPAIVHRDFTPDNLLLDQNGVLKLIDFNVVHELKNEAKTAVVGKHAYMPPEQFAGRPTIQSDIYALGATLYYIVCGEDPEPFSQSSLVSDAVDLNPIWGEIIRNCTALEKAERFRQSHEVLRLLNDALGNSEILSGASLICHKELSEEVFA